MGFQERLVAAKKAQEAAEQSKNEAAEKAAAEKAKAEKEARHGELSVEREKVAAEFSQAEQAAKDAENSLVEGNEWAESQGENLAPEAKAEIDALNTEATEAKQNFERLKSELERIDAELSGVENIESVAEPAVEAAVESVAEPAQAEEAVEAVPAEAAVEEKVDATEAKITAENAPEVKNEKMILDDEAERGLMTEEQSRVDDLKSFLGEIKVGEDEKKSFKQIEGIEGELGALLDDKLVKIAGRWFDDNDGVMKALKRKHPDYYESKLEEMKDGFIDDNNLNPHYSKLIDNDLGHEFVLGGMRGKKAANYERNKPLRIILETYKAGLAEANKELNDEGNTLRNRRMAEIDSLIDKSSKLLSQASQIPERKRLVLGEVRDLNVTLDRELEKANYDLRKRLEESGVGETKIGYAKNKYIEELKAMKENLRKMKE